MFKHVRHPQRPRHLRFDPCLRLAKELVFVGRDGKEGSIANELLELMAGDCWLSLARRAEGRRRSNPVVFRPALWLVNLLRTLCLTCDRHPRPTARSLLALRTPQDQTWQGTSTRPFLQQATSCLSSVLRFGGDALPPELGLQAAGVRAGLVREGDSHDRPLSVMTTGGRSGRGDPPRR